MVKYGISLTTLGCMDQDSYMMGVRVIERASRFSA